MYRIELRDYLHTLNEKKSMFGGTDSFRAADAALQIDPPWPTGRRNWRSVFATTPDAPVSCALGD
jgi:hypothetical protein